jgi:hypothetical protein
VSDDFDPYYRWLAIPPEEQPPHYYRLLALRAFESDEEVIQNAADLRMLQLRSAQTGKHAALSQKLLNEVAAARACLLNPRRRAEYDAELKRQLGEQQIAGPGQAPVAAPPLATTPLDSVDEGSQNALASADQATLPDLLSADPLSNAALPTSKPVPVGYSVAAAPATSASSYRSASRNPLLWIGAVVGVLALFACIVAAVVAVAAFAPESTDESNAVAGDSIATSPVNPANAAKVAEFLGDDALLVYTFEPEAVVEKDGQRIVRNQAGSDFDGLIQGDPQPQIGPGKVGAGLRFFGRNGQVVIPEFRDELAKDRTEFTVAVWINPDSKQLEANQPETEIGSGHVFDVGWMGSECINLRVKDKDFAFILATRQGGKGLTAPWDGRSGWRHLAAVWDGKEQRFYVDGRLAAREATTLKSLNRRTLYAPKSRARLGITAKSYNDGNRYYHGVMDELIVLSRALSDEEVARLVQLQASR